MNQELHRLKVIGFSTAFDICSLLERFDCIVYTVNAHYVSGKFDLGYVEYEIVYHYVIEGD